MTFAIVMTAVSAVLWVAAAVVYCRWVGRRHGPRAAARATWACLASIPAFLVPCWLLGFGWAGQIVALVAVTGVTAVFRRWLPLPRFGDRS